MLESGISGNEIRFTWHVLVKTLHTMRYNFQMFEFVLMEKWLTRIYSLCPSFKILYITVEKKNSVDDKHLEI